MSSYGWIIDIDHMPEESIPAPSPANAKGVYGPHDIPDWMERMLLSGRKPGSVLHQRIADRPCRIYQFKIYDDDGELYYTGRMITEGEPDDEACAGPLDDFGRPNAGATEIRYPGHPEMDI